ncbi:MAG: 2-C-methyl-D-erythritol 2,4-cyclodiphosphate synthase [Rickettsiales bacterium]
MKFRVGTGFDVHKFDTTQGEYTVPLCGVPVAHTHKVLAHSDGDVALHAIMDAMLGAASMGDIGEHFPPSDIKWKDANSVDLLKHVHQLIQKKGGKIANIDVTIICERPRVSKFKPAMEAKLAEALDLEKDQVNVKATTTEKLGFTGREEGIAAQAACLIYFD